MFYMQNKGRGKAAKVVNFVTKWLNLCLSTVMSEILSFNYNRLKIHYNPSRLKSNKKTSEGYYGKHWHDPILQSDFGITLKVSILSTNLWLWSFDIHIDNPKGIFLCELTYV